MRYLVTGVSRGIGLEIARQLITGGHEVYGIVRPSTGSGNEVQGDISGSEGTGLAGVGRADLSDPATIADALAGFAATFDGLDGLIHSAGVVRGGSLEETTAADFGAQFDVNVTAAAEVTKLFLPQLRTARGTVVFINSTSGLAASSPTAAYAASKFALRAYADALRQDEPTLRVTSVFPSRTGTDMQRELREIEQAEYDADDYLRPETVAAVAVSALTLPDDGVVTDVTLRPRPRR